MGGGLACWLTAPAAGAIAAFQIRADPSILSETLGIELPALGEAGLRRICDLDEAMVLRPEESAIVVTPHGGPRLRQRLVRALSDRGITFLQPDKFPSREIYCETRDKLESKMLRALAKAESADAIPLLLAQPTRWKNYGEPQAGDLPRSNRLRRLIDPPTVVLAGAPNAGKSTLFNALVGRTAAVASPVAGTTRDFVSAKVVLAGLTCRVIDAPGFVQSSDAIEQAAISRAWRELSEADLVVALAAPDQEWPSINLGQILRVRSMSDLSQTQAPPDEIAFRLSARSGEGLADFAKAVREILVPAADLACERPWQFW